MEKKVLNGETSQVKQPDSSELVEDSGLKHKLIFRNKTLLVLLIVLVGLLVFTVTKLASLRVAKTNFPQPSNLVYPSPTSNLPTLLPTGIQTNAQLPKPRYKVGEFLTFTHFAQGFSIDYPAELMPELRGATGGNFFLEIGDENNKSALWIYPEYPLQDLSKLNLDNVTDLSYEYYGSEPKIIPPEEKIIKKEQITIGGAQAYKIISDIERIIVPRKNTVLVINVENKSVFADKIDEIINTFSLIPSVPDNWDLYSDNKVEGFRLRYPSNYSVEVLDNNATSFSYDVVFDSSEGKITFSFYNETSPMRHYFVSADRYSYNIDAAIQAEQFLKEDVATSKFNQNAFTFAQGGDSAIRVTHPLKQDFNLYFYLSGARSIRLSAPSNLESIVNQMLVSLNEGYNK